MGRSYHRIAGPVVAPMEIKAVATRVSPKQTIEIWDNDGIVNTLSMFWSLGTNVLVHADHMDIVGQYRSERASCSTGRKYSTYDLLKSDSGFDDEMFNEVWTDIFNFSLGRTSASRAFRAAA